MFSAAYNSAQRAEEEEEAAVAAGNATAAMRTHLHTSPLSSPLLGQRPSARAPSSPSLQLKQHHPQPPQQLCADASAAITSPTSSSTAGPAVSLSTADEAEVTKTRTNDNNINNANLNSVYNFLGGNSSGASSVLNGGPPSSSASPAFYYYYVLLWFQDGRLPLPGVVRRGGRRWRQQQQALPGHRAQQHNNNENINAENEEEDDEEDDHSFFFHPLSVTSGDNFALNSIHNNTSSSNNNNNDNGFLSDSRSADQNTSKHTIAYKSTTDMMAVSTPLHCLHEGPEEEHSEGDREAKEMKNNNSNTEDETERNYEKSFHVESNSASACSSPSATFPNRESSTTSTLTPTGNNNNKDNNDSGVSVRSSAAFYNKLYASALSKTSALERDEARQFPLLNLITSAIMNSQLYLFSPSASSSASSFSGAKKSTIFGGMRRGAGGGSSMVREGRRKEKKVEPLPSFSYLLLPALSTTNTATTAAATSGVSEKSKTVGTSNHFSSAPLASAGVASSASGKNSKAATATTTNAVFVPHALVAYYHHYLAGQEKANEEVAAAASTCRDSNNSTSNTYCRADKNPLLSLRVGTSCDDNDTVRSLVWSGCCPPWTRAAAYRLLSQYAQAAATNTPGVSGNNNNNNNSSININTNSAPNLKTGTGTMPFSSPATAAAGAAATNAAKMNASASPGAAAATSVPIRFERARDDIQRKRRQYENYVRHYWPNEQQQQQNKLSRQSSHSFSSLSRQEEAIINQIALDLPRHRQAIYRHATTAASLARVLFIFSQRFPATGYVQGMDDIAMVFYIIFLTDALRQAQLLAAAVVAEGAWQQHRRQQQQVSGGEKESAKQSKAVAEEEAQQVAMTTASAAAAAQAVPHFPRAALYHLLSPAASAEDTNKAATETATLLTEEGLYAMEEVPQLDRLLRDVETLLVLQQEHPDEEEEAEAEEDSVASSSAPPSSYAQAHTPQEEGEEGRQAGKDECRARAGAAAAAMDALLLQVEADTYWMTSKLLGELQDHYRPGQPGLLAAGQRVLTILRSEFPEFIDKCELDERAEDAAAAAGPVRHHQHPKVTINNTKQHHRDTSAPPGAALQQFISLTYQWMHCLLIRELPFPLVLKVWDTHRGVGEEQVATFHACLCAALILTCKEIIMATSMDTLIFVFKNPYRYLFPDGFPRDDGEEKEEDGEKAAEHAKLHETEPFGALSPRDDGGGVNTSKSRMSFGFSIQKALFGSPNSHNNNNNMNDSSGGGGSSNGSHAGRRKRSKKEERARQLQWADTLIAEGYRIWLQYKL